MKWHELRSLRVSDVIDWAESQPWCRAMADCRQDPEWHAEGDVWTHTKLVLCQLEQLEEWPGLSLRDQTVLTFTALFHDSAKPLTTSRDPETGRVTSHGHAVRGERLARTILRELECDLPTREEIARLVRYHGRPAFLLEKPDPDAEVVRLSWLTSSRLLYLFALADTRGRDTESMSRPEENLHFWKMLAQEHGCYDRPYAFASDHARFMFSRDPEACRHYVPHEKYTCTVSLISGLPGSGKDSWLTRHRSDLPVVSLDDLRDEFHVAPTENQGQVAQLARERCREFLRAGRPFAFNATNTLRLTRARWIDLFADYHARIEIIWVEPTFATILKQNRSREFRVPEAVICRLAEKYEPPTWLECHSLLLTDGSGG